VRDRGTGSSVIGDVSPASPSKRGTSLPLDGRTQSMKPTPRTSSIVKNHSSPVVWSS